MLVLHSAVFMVYFAQYKYLTMHDIFIDLQQLNVQLNVHYSQVIYRALFTILIVSKQLYTIKQYNYITKYIE